MPELKPCPFCGGEAKLAGGGGAWYWVQCKSCRAETKGCHTKWQAEAAWNKRFDGGEIEYDYEAED